jgi:hypothetical protein
MDSTESADQILIEGWLGAMGCSTTNIKPINPQVHWQIQFDYPPKSGHTMAIINPFDRPKAFMVLTEVEVSPEHVTAHRSLDDDDKLDFLDELRGALNRDFVEFIWTGVDHPLACPTKFQVSATRYRDGLSLDSLARTVSSVYKTEVAGIAVVQRRLNPRTSGGSGSFEFRRTGGLQ